MEESLTPEFAKTLVQTLRKCVRTEYPNNPNHTLFGSGDVRTPKSLHPAFYGCFDWHSAVHSHWSLARLLNRELIPNREPALELLHQHLTRDNIQAELDYLSAPGREHFERTYGWAWFLMLSREVSEGAFGVLPKNLRPLEIYLWERLRAFLPSLSEPNQSGLHNNTAFTLGLLWDCSLDGDKKQIRELVRAKALEFFGTRVESSTPRQGEQKRLHQGPYDFLSTELTEADLMCRLLAQPDFTAWFNCYLPGFDGGDLKPADVPDRADGYLVHRDGLNLSRSWCLRRIARTLGSHDPRHDSLIACAERHANASLPHVASGHFAGEHWLPTFAVYLLTS